MSFCDYLEEKETKKTFEDQASEMSDYEIMHQLGKEYSDKENSVLIKESNRRILRKLIRIEKFMDRFI